MELLYGDSTVLCWKILKWSGKWKSESGKIEEGIRMKGYKGKYLKSKASSYCTVKRSYVWKVDPCCFCGKRVGCNSIVCIKCL